MMKMTFKVNENDAGQRLDKYLKNNISDMSRTQISSFIDKSLCTVNGNTAKSSYVVAKDDEIILEVPEAKDVEIEAQDMNLNIVYEDEDVLVVDKPSGMVVHPAAGNTDQTLVNGLLYEVDSLGGIKGELRPGIVHRIDKNTSGLLMVAKNDYALNNLQEQLKEHSVNRRYIGLVVGTITEEKGRIDAPIGRDPQDRKKMAVVRDGKNAITNFIVLERYKKFTLCEFKLETGRTHQIRVHMKYIGHPLVGDPEYGNKKLIDENGQYLHAAVLGFVHPRTGKYLEFRSELPDYFKEYLNNLEK